MPLVLFPGLRQGRSASLHGYEAVQWDEKHPGDPQVPGAQSVAGKGAVCGFYIHPLQRQRPGKMWGCPEDGLRGSEDGQGKSDPRGKPTDTLFAFRGKVRLFLYSAYGLFSRSHQ